MTNNAVIWEAAEMAADALGREYRTHQNKLEFECHLWALLSYSCPVPILDFTLLLETQKHQLKTIHFCHAQKCVAVPKAV